MSQDQLWAKVSRPAKQLGLSTCVSLLVICSDFGSLPGQEVRRPPRVSVHIGAGLSTPLTDLGSVGYAEGRQLASPLITLAIEANGRRRTGFRLATAVATSRGIEVSPLPGCSGSCTIRTIRAGRLVAFGAEASFAQRPGNRGIRLSVGPWLRSYHRPGERLNVCDLDFYCAAAVSFGPSHTTIGGRLAVAVRAGSRFPVEVELGNLVSKYRTGAVQHNLMIAATVGFRIR